jgi:hypothetical protein
LQSESPKTYRGSLLDRRGSRKQVSLGVLRNEHWRIPDDGNPSSSS